MYINYIKVHFTFMMELCLVALGNQNAPIWWGGGGRGYGLVSSTPHDRCLLSLLELDSDWLEGQVGRTSSRQQIGSKDYNEQQRHGHRVFVVMAD